MSEPEDITPGPIPEPPKGYKSGYVTIMGKPNAGKSTFLNAVLGTKLSIISPKVQTTRHRITGIHSDDRGQIVFLDTPGFLEPRYKLHEKMMHAVRRSVEDADLILFILDPGDVPSEEELAWFASYRKKPVLLMVNKSDRFKEATITAAAEQMAQQLHLRDTRIISALNLEGVPELVEQIFALLPEGPPFFPPDQLSEHPERFFVSELIREQLFHLYRAEIPYSCAVNIISFEAEPEITRIDAEIVVSRNSQKGIVIGKGGTALKKLGTEARKEIQQFLGTKVYLNLFVKVREKWRENETFLRSYGYNS
ncbi:MAG: GTPase Era [Candidatus Cyclonatronum sp.]|uniref:GTPase Era n=1 Tax=Cyclonatronum sp. TaxID=3024185 RepID=UPI0025BCAD58|nr:GTPase Era [Cyclonatronum sp.]MCH8486417.1 GTPase Era [Cyclonatronum sp.]